MKPYNQNFNDFSSDCTLVSLYTIILLQYWIKVPYSLIDKTINLALKAKVLFKQWAVFETIYNWYSDKITEKLWVKTKVYKINMYSEYFKKLYKLDIYFGIWLKRGNQKYIDSIKKWYLTKKDIDSILKYPKKGFHHNNVVWMGKLYEVYWGYVIKLPYDVLKYGIDKWLFWVIARTIIPDWRFNKFVSWFLRDLKDDNKFKYVWRSILKQHAFKEAVSIREKFIG
jgi:hypothetical protein